MGSQRGRRDGEQIGGAGRGDCRRPKLERTVHITE